MESKKYYWEMKDGNKIDVDKMTKNHLRNVLKMIMRNQEKLTSGVVPFSNRGIDAITGGAIGENSESYCDDWMWK